MREPCCSDCLQFESPKGRLERWRTAGIKRLVKAKILAGGRDKFRHSPLEVATLLATHAGDRVPRCMGEAWAYLKASYDPAVTKPSKECRRNDARKNRFRGGKYAGTPLGEVPLGYLAWAIDSGVVDGEPALRDAVRHAIQKRLS
jgi:hypothetical protein